MSPKPINTTPGVRYRTPDNKLVTKAEFEKSTASSGKKSSGKTIADAPAAATEDTAKEE